MTGYLPSWAAPVTANLKENKINLTMNLSDVYESRDSEWKELWWLQQSSKTGHIQESMAVKRVIIQQPNLGLDTFGSDPKFFGCFGNRLPPQQHIIWAGFLCQSFCRHHKVNSLWYFAMETEKRTKAETWSKRRRERELDGERNTSSGPPILRRPSIRLLVKVYMSIASETRIMWRQILRGTRNKVILQKHINFLLTTKVLILIKSLITYKSIIRFYLLALILHKNEKVY